MNVLKFVSLIAVSATIGAASASAQDKAPEQPSPAVVAYAQEFVAKWSGDAKLIEAIKASTAKNSKLDYNEVTILDSQWRVAKSGVEKEKRAAEVLKELAPGKSIDEQIKEGEALIKTTRASETSQFLTEQLGKAEPKGAITEVFVMDGWGWNVGQTGGTSDYYQGDEGKWQKTFASADPKEIEILEIVEEDGIRSAQVSLPIKENGKNIGAVTVGVDVGIVK
jgi:opacity protein-like surface antigen